MTTALNPTAPAARSLAVARLRTVLLTIIVSVVTVTLLRDRPWSDGRTAAALNAVNGALLLGHVARRRDEAMARLLLFGLVFGAVELVADALCVRYTHTLDYGAARSAMVGLSPWWMPTAWMVVAVQIGYIGTRLMAHFGAWPGGVLLTALLGAVNIPFYEEMAWHAHWWRYGHCRLVGHTPVYVIVAELLIGLTLGPLAQAALRGDTGDAARAGLLGGLGTIGAGLLGYGLVERIL